MQHQSIFDMHWETQLTENMQIHMYKLNVPYKILDNYTSANCVYTNTTAHSIFLMITSPAQNLQNWLVARCVGIYQRHRQYSKCHTRSSLPSPEYEHIDKHERKAVLMRQHATNRACTLVYIQLKSHFEGYNEPNMVVYTTTLNAPNQLASKRQSI